MHNNYWKLHTHWLNIKVPNYYWQTDKYNMQRLKSDQKHQTISYIFFKGINVHCSLKITLKLYIILVLLNIFMFLYLINDQDYYPGCPGCLTMMVD